MADLINDRYRVVRELGSGGMGRVLLAEDTARDDAQVALKIVGPPDVPASDRILSEALTTEFETLARLSHPNLTPVHDFGRIPDRGSLFLSMEFVEGRELLEAAAAMEPAEVLAVLAQVGHALEYIHTRGLVHGDVKPQNILVTGGNGSPRRAVLVDFGLAARARSEGQLRGTLHYAAPEILRRQSVDRRADLYALGVVLYRLASGRCPFDGSSSDIIRGIVETPPDPLPSSGNGLAADAPLRSFLGDGLSGVIMKLLEKEPARRYRTAVETIQALANATGVELPLESPEMRDAYSAAASLVGRDDESEVVEKILERLPGRLEQGLPARESALVVVVGEAGSGKSRFLDGMRRRAQVRGILAASVRCEPDAAAFQTISQALSLLAAGRLAPPKTGGDSLSVERARLRMVDAAASALVSRASREPVVLLVDDAHLADEGTAAVLEALGRDPSRAPALLLVLSCRSEEMGDAPFSATLEKLRNTVKTEEITLAPLTSEHTGRMLEEMFGLDEAPRALVDLVHRETSGNPFFIEQAVRSLMEDGTISRIGEGFRADVDALTRISFPAGVGEVIRNRLGRLSPDERLALEALAVIGLPADLELAGEASGLDAAALETALTALAGRRLVATTPDGEIAVVSARTREVVYEGIEWERRRAMHRAVGEMLSRRKQSGRTVRHEDLARHFIHGAEPEVALRHATEAAAVSRRMGAPGEAREFFRQAVGLLPQGAEDRRAEIFIQIGQIDRELGRDDQALEAFDQALRSAESASRRDLAGRARLERADVHLRRGRSEEVVREVELALQILSLDGDAALVSRAYNYLAGSHGRAGRLERALDLQKRALEAAEKTGEPAVRASAHNNLGMILCLLERQEEGFPNLERAIALRAECGDRQGEMETRSNLGALMAKSGDLEGAVSCLEQAVALARTEENLRLLVESQINLGQARVALGHHDLAAPSFEQAAAVAIRIGDDLRAAYALDAWGASLRTIGDVESARVRHQEALERARRCDDPAQELYVLGSLALDCLASGEASKAKEYLRRGARISHSEGQLLARLRLAEAEVLAALEDRAPAEALERAGEMVEKASEAGLGIGAARGHYLVALAREASGDHEGAEESYRRSLDAATDPRADETRWRALAALGRIARAARDKNTARGMFAAACELVAALAGRIQDPETRSRYLAAPERQALRAQQGQEASTAPVAATGGGLALGALYRISELITSAADLDELLPRVLDLALEIVRAERGLIILVDEDGERQSVRAAREVEEETIADALEYSHSVVKEAAGGKTLVMIDAEDDRSFKRFRSVSLFHIKSLACVPIRVRDRVLGTVYLDSRSEGYLFREEDLEFLKAFANLAGSAIEVARLHARLSRENISLQREVHHLRKAAGERNGYGQIVGRTPRMQAIYDKMDRVANTNLNVLITGESGTGKELVARALHFGGPRKDRRFIAINVSAIPETLLESELFGAVKGAFTGADRTRKGVFEEADGGTLFLDEIGDMPMNLQAKLLRALQEGEVRPVGSTRDIKVDVRILSATNKNLQELMKEGQFREDLYFRLLGVPIDMPALRERKEDIPLLVEHFLEQFARKEQVPRKKLDISALQLLVRYEWPGNIRELENEISKLAALTANETITQQDLLEHPELFEKLTQIEARGPVFRPLHETEKLQIEKALAVAEGNRARAAELLGISRATIYRKIKEHRISI